MRRQPCFRAHGTLLQMCRYTTRTSAVENEDFTVTKARLIERGNQFADTATRARVAIAEVGSRFITQNSTVLVHGYSRVVSSLLQRAVHQGAHFSLVVTECRLEEAGLKWAKELAPMGVPVSIILDSAVAYHMDRYASTNQACSATCFGDRLSRPSGGFFCIDTLEYCVV